MSIRNAATGEGPYPYEHTCPKCGGEATISSHNHRAYDESGNFIGVIWMGVGYRCIKCGLIFCDKCKGENPTSIIKGGTTAVDGKVLRD